MRFFIALEIPNENKAQFQSIQSNLHTLIPQARLTDVDKIHLTLAFIENQPDYIKVHLIKTLQKAAVEIAPFEVIPAYLDGFPNIHNPQVLWVGVKGDIDRIHILHERIQDDLKQLNLPTDERRFTHHISIAKLHNFPIGPGLERKLEQIMAANFQPIPISCIKLFESIPQDGFHKHNTLAEIPLISAKMVIQQLQSNLIEQ